MVCVRDSRCGNNNGDNSEPVGEIPNESNHHRSRHRLPQLAGSIPRHHHLPKHPQQSIKHQVINETCTDFLLHITRYILIYYALQLLQFDCLQLQHNSTPLQFQRRRLKGGTQLLPQSDPIIVRHDPGFQELHQQDLSGGKRESEAVRFCGG